MLSITFPTSTSLPSTKQTIGGKITILPFLPSKAHNSLSTTRITEFSLTYISLLVMKHHRRRILYFHIFLTCRQKITILPFSPSEFTPGPSKDPSSFFLYPNDVMSALVVSKTQDSNTLWPIGCPQWAPPIHKPSSYPKYNISQVYCIIGLYSNSFSKPNSDHAQVQSECPRNRKPLFCL